MSRLVDHDPEGTPVGRCVVLPGRRYSPDGPLLFFAAQTALARGWGVRQVWWDALTRDSQDVATETAWVTDQLAAALEGYDGRVLIVAKSLGTLAAPAAAARGLDAAWLTPILTDAAVAAALTAYPARQLTLIGTDDPYLDRAVFDTLPGEQLLVPGDHVLRVGGDPTAMVASHHRFVRVFDDWLRDADAR
jgi:hypothetical protein